MSKKSEFISYVERAIENFSEEMNDDAKIYWESFKSSGVEKERAQFTDNGKLILRCLQDNIETMPVAKARDIAEELFVSSRMVSGAIRRLVADGYVEKIGQDPVIYTLTEKGKNVTID